MTLTEPPRFRELCEKVGLAIMLGQKVQFALAYYYSLYSIKNRGWNSEKAQSKIRFHLSKPMGVIVKAIEQDAPLDDVLFNDICDYKKRRNWLVHDFDEESYPFIWQGQKLDYYIETIEGIAVQSYRLIDELNKVGEKLQPLDLSLL